MSRLLLHGVLRVGLLAACVLSVCSFSFLCFVGCVVGGVASVVVVGWL